MAAEEWLQELEELLFNRYTVSVLQDVEFSGWMAVMVEYQWKQLEELSSKLTSLLSNLSLKFTPFRRLLFSRPK